MTNRVATSRTLRWFVNQSATSSLLRNFHDTGNNVACLDDQHFVTDGNIQSFNVIPITESGIGDSRSTDTNGVEICHRGNRTRMTNLKSHTTNNRLLALSIELDSDLTLGTTTGFTHLQLFDNIVQLDHDTINPEIQLLAFVARLGEEIPNSVNGA